MPAGTITGGPLTPIEKCYIIIPFKGENTTTPSRGQFLNRNPFIQNGEFKIVLNNLPEITDTKSASYADEVVIGRSTPLKTYSQSDNRNISMQIHMIVSKPSDIGYNLNALRAIQSAVYPREGKEIGPFIPPPVCRIKCGSLLGNNELCVILKNYTVKFPTEVAWEENTFVPFKFDIDTSWDVVYKSSALPGQEKIFSLGG